MREHTIPSTNRYYSDIGVSEYEYSDNVALGRTYDGGYEDSFNINSGEREALGRLLLNSVDGVSVLEENDPTPAQEAEDDGHDENQSLPDTRDKYDWFSPNAPNVTCLTDRDKYDVNKYIVEKERTCTLVEQIGHHYKHVQLHEKEVENLCEVWEDDESSNWRTNHQERLSRVAERVLEDDGDGNYGHVQDSIDRSSEGDLCVCGRPNCDDGIVCAMDDGGTDDSTPAQEIADESVDDDKITECLCGHDPHWEDHGLCPFEDDDSDDDTVVISEEVERKADEILAAMDPVDEEDTSQSNHTPVQNMRDVERRLNGLQWQLEQLESDFSIILEEGQ